MFYFKKRRGVCFTYPELIEEHFEIDAVAAVFWESWKHLSPLVFAYLDAEVH